MEGVLKQRVRRGLKRPLRNGRSHEAEFWILLEVTHKDARRLQRTETQLHISNRHTFIKRRA